MTQASQGPVIIFDSHPVQYKAPIYGELQRLAPGRFEAVYCTDCSVRGHSDPEFGRQVAWDTPLLDGYTYTVLTNVRGVPLSGFRSLSGRRVYGHLRKRRPKAILISQFLYEADFVALLAARLLKVPVAIRHETQDEAQSRGPLKSLVRAMTYRLLYSQVSRAFFIGELNREHLLCHGFRQEQLTRAAYCVRDPVEHLSTAEKEELRSTRRKELGLRDDDFVVLFSGKLIPKKDPGLVIKSVELLPTELRRRTTILFMGSGGLEPELRKSAAELEGSVRFLGFVNQSELGANYLAADVLLLPSRRMGETWGLVVNEALHAGCAVIMTDAVGCHREFGAWERVRVIPEGDAKACARALEELSTFERSMIWSAKGMEAYSIRAAAEGIVSGFGEERRAE